MIDGGRLFYRLLSLRLTAHVLPSRRVVSSFSQSLRRALRVTAFLVTISVWSNRRSSSGKGPQNTDVLDPHSLKPNHRCLSRVGVPPCFRHYGLTVDSGCLDSLGRSGFIEPVGTDTPVTAHMTAVLFISSYRSGKESRVGENHRFIRNVIDGDPPRPPRARDEYSTLTTTWYVLLLGSYTCCRTLRSWKTYVMTTSSLELMSRSLRPSSPNVERSQWLRSTKRAYPICTAPFDARARVPPARRPCE